MPVIEHPPARCQFCGNADPARWARKMHGWLCEVCERFTHDGRSVPFDGPVPRDVYEQQLREWTSYVEAWRDRTLHAEAALRRIAAGEARPSHIAGRALDDAR